MNKATLWFAVFGIVLGFSLTKNPEDCPLVPCPLILHPESCRTTTFFVHGEGQVCQSCDKCIQPSAKLDDSGCPVRGCYLMRIPEKCKREIYYVYQGRKICKDCPQNTCSKAG